MKVIDHFWFCIFMRIPTCTNTHILLVDMARLLKMTLSIQKLIRIFFKFYDAKITEL